MQGCVYIFISEYLLILNPIMGASARTASADLSSWKDKNPFLRHRKVSILGAPLIEGQNLTGADQGPEKLIEAGLPYLLQKLNWEVDDITHLDFKTEFAKMQEEATELVEEETCDPYKMVCNARTIGRGVEMVFDKARAEVDKGGFLLTIGGDHSIAAGSIAALTMDRYKDLAVIWVDAHADANTPLTSPSMHYHGMPAAHLFGWFERNPPGFEWFPKTRCLDESRVAYIGLRDLDRAEVALLKNSGIHLYTIRDVDRLGIAGCINEALQRIDPNNVRPLHLSLDIDAIDPQFAPGSGTLSRGGLTYREVHYICEEMALTERLVSMDLVEINPALDPPCDIPEHGMHGDDPDLKPSTQTVQLGVELVLSAMGKSIL
eukprot:GEMP01039440.1.p1 GENE.GEMP01039440.1~~GEMP01039440.1.p1  ORF type:complete len:385 (+),score=53.13 GEMP01039440.1:30-1157(+)